MKKILHILIFTILVALMCCMFTVASSAAETKYYWKDPNDANAREWEFTISQVERDGATVNVATITGASLKDNEEVRTSELNIPSVVYITDTVNNTVTAYTVTTIGKEAFKCGDNFNAGPTFLAKKYFGHVTLPSTLEKIESYAFAYSAIYGELVIPDSVTSIGEYAFLGCVGLDTVTFPSGADTVPKGCFQQCKALVEFRTSGDITTFSESCFQECESLLKVEIPANVKKVEKKAFYNCKCLNGTIDLTNLTDLGEQAFQHCSFIEKVILGTCKFTPNAFWYCSSLKEIYINNDNYISVDGIVFHKTEVVNPDGSKGYTLDELCLYPSAKIATEYTIPNSVTTIGEAAFYDANLSRIYISSSVKTINKNAFEKSSVECMYFPSTLNDVKESVLVNCPNLKWAIFESGITKISSSSVGNTSDHKNVSLEYVFSKDGKTISTDKFTAYIEGRDCIAHYGSHFYGQLDTPASCDVDGKYVCCLCGDEAVAKAPGHVGQIIASSSFSCISNESITIRCINCKADKEVISKASLGGHNWSEPVTVTDPKYSFTYSRCTVCTEVNLSAFTTSVYINGDVNGDGVIDSKDVTLLGKIVNGDASNANLFACDINGDDKINSLDLVLLKQHVSKLGNTISKNNNVCAKHVHIVTKNVYAENCTEAGMRVSFCSDCGDIISKKVVDGVEIVGEKTNIVGHMFTETVITAATCYSKGRVARACVCGYADEIETDTLPHTHSWFVLTDNDINYEYSYCAVPECRVFEHREVNRRLLDEVAKTIPNYYPLYCTSESTAKLRPIAENAKKALTQDEVDKMVVQIREVLPTIQYKVQDIPVIYLETPYEVSKSHYNEANIIVAYKDANGNLQTLTDSEGQIKLRGNATSASNIPKRPYNIKFSRKVNLLGMGEGKKYCLLANALDTSTIRNAVALEFAGENGLGLQYTSKYRFVEVYFNGTYKGCYTILTPISIGEDRIDIDEEKDVVIHLSNTNGAEDAAFPSPIFYLKLMRLELPSEYTAFTRSQMMRTMYQLDFAILSGDTDEMAKYMDMDSMTKYFIFHEYVKDLDIIWDSTRFYIKDGKLYGGPIWDLDISQGNVRVQNKMNDGFDLSSGYYYWHPDKIYTSSEYTQYNKDLAADMDAAGEFRSALGTWADAAWAPDYTNGNDKQRRWWFSYMIEYSDEFKAQVAQYIVNNEAMFKKFYDQTMKDPDTEEPISCVIEDLALDGEASKAIARNYSYGPFGPATHPNNLTYGEDNLLSDAIVYLRTWWQTRCEWLHEYYSTWLKEYNAANANP